MFEHAGSAIQELTKTQYPLIVTYLRLASGIGWDDPQLDEIMSDRGPFGTFSPPHCLAGLHLISKVREDGSANKDTPIIVMDGYEPNQPFKSLRYYF